MASTGIFEPKEDLGINDAPYAFWRAQGYSEADTEQLTRAVDSTLMAAKLTFQGEGRAVVRITQKTWDRKEGHFPSIINFASELAARPTLRNRQGSVLIWLEDGVWEGHEHYTRLAPVLSFGKTIYNHHTFVMPDPAFIDSKGYLEEIEKIRNIEQGLSFETKRRTVFFRGAAVGPGIESENWPSTPRARISILSRDLNRPDVLDAKMTKMDHLPAAQQAALSQAGVIGDYVKFDQFLQYLYLIHADGYHCSWPSLYTKLATNSVVVRILGHFEQWYYHDLIPWKHYVPLTPELYDFKQVQEWLVNNDKAVQEIISNAHTFIQARLSYEYCLAETEHLCAKILDLYRR